MSKNVAGVFLDSVTGEPDIEYVDGFPSEKRVRDIATAIAESTHTISIQTVLAEVDEVIYNEENLTDDLTRSHIGCIRVSPVVPMTILPENGKGWVFPVDSQIKSYPIRGEIVAIINLGAQTFYYPAVNMMNNVNNNLRVGLTAKPTVGAPIESKIDAFLGDFSTKNYSRPVKQFPGDWAINGRNDQSIRIGKTKDSTDSAVIKLRISKAESVEENNLLPLTEDPNIDVSSFYMSREEIIKLNIVPNVSIDVTPNEFSGPLILFDSNTITFNTKKDNINIYSANNTNLVSKQRTHVIGKSVWIGDDLKENLQHAVLAENTAKLLHEAFQEIVKFAQSLTNATGIGNLGQTVPIPGLMASAAGVDGYFGTMSESSILNRIKSPNVMISRRSKDKL